MRDVYKGGIHINRTSSVHSCASREIIRALYSNLREEFDHKRKRVKQFTRWPYP